MLKHFVTHGFTNRWPRMPFGRPPETVPLSFGKRGWLFASVVALATAGFGSGAYADLLVCNDANNTILRHDERTGDFLGEFIPSGSGGLSGPRGLIFGPDGNLYVSGDRVFRYDGITGEPLPSPGNTGATFCSGGQSAAWLIFGPDGNLYVTS